MTIGFDGSSDFACSLVDISKIARGSFACRTFSACLLPVSPSEVRFVLAVISPICTSVMLVLGLVNHFFSLVVMLCTSYHSFARTRFIRKALFVFEGPMLQVSKVRSMFTNEVRDF